MGTVSKFPVNELILGIGGNSTRPAIAKLGR